MAALLKFAMPIWGPFDCSLRSSESQNYLWNLVTYLNLEFQFSMTMSPEFIREGSGSTFDVCHVLLTPFWLPLRSYESQNSLWNLVTNLNPEFQLSMTISSGFIREGSCSTFEVCHALLTPFWLPLRSSESQNCIWNLITYLNPEFPLSITNSSGFIE